jgi:HAD superfamily hydrolase (TIGR01490 family)
MASQLGEAAFFDLDKTVIARASIAAFSRPLYHGGLISRRSAARALYGQLVYLRLGASEEKLARIRESALRLTKGWNRDRVCQIVEETLLEIVEPIIYAEALELIELHRAASRQIVIVSASPEEIAVPLGRHLGADAIIASRAEVDRDGRYTGAMDFYAFGPYKASAMQLLAERTGIDLERSYAYSDSVTDLPMLEAVGHPTAVNPDRVLERVAKDRDWEMLRFTRPVRLRDRVHAPPAKPTIAVTLGAAVLGAGAIAVGWWVESRRGASSSGAA